MYLIIGGSGFLGSYLIKAVHALTGENVVATTRAVLLPPDEPRLKWLHCDVSDLRSVERLLTTLPERDDFKIFYLAATHHPDLVEADPNAAWEVNVTALSRFLNALPAHSKLCYASSDSIYGESEPHTQFNEDSPQRPINAYGRQKCAADALCRFAGYTTLRYPFLIGPSLVPGRKHFYDRIASELRAGREVEMLSDSLRSALTFAQAAVLSVRLMELSALPSAINVCSDKALFKYDIGARIAAMQGVSAELVRPVTCAAASRLFAATPGVTPHTIAPRARSTVMSNTLLKTLLRLDTIELAFTPPHRLYLVDNTYVYVKFHRLKLSRPPAHPTVLPAAAA